MTLLSVVKEVCAAVGVAVPQSVFTNIAGNRTMQEMLALANEMAQRVSYDNRDWQLLRRAAKHLAGSGATIDPANPFTIGCDAFSLPVNFKRLLLTANVWRSTNTTMPMTFVPDTDEWMNRRVGNRNSHPYGEWTIIGGQLLVFPALTSGQSVHYAYLDKNCITLAGGGVGDAFLSDTDSFSINERVLKLGMVWQWKAQKGSPYAEDMGTYSDAIASVAGRDSPSPIIIGRSPMSANARVAYPWQVPTP